MTTTQNPVVEVLRAAREKVANGWTKGTYRIVLESGCLYCADGAILWSGGPSVDECHSRAERFLRQVIGGDRTSVVKWNDAPERTQEEVVNAFTKAIELAEAAQ